MVIPVHAPGWAQQRFGCTHSDLALGMACPLVAGIEMSFLCYHKQFKWHPDCQGFKSVLGRVLLLRWLST